MEENSITTTDITNQSTCVICGGQGNKWFSKGSRSFWKCKSCGLIWIPEGLHCDESDVSIYEQDSPVFFWDGNESYYLDETNFQSCRKKLDWIKKYSSPNSSMLDVGANFGHFMHESKSTFNVEGIEISSTAVKWAKEKLDIDIKVGSIYDLHGCSENPYDIVTCWDVVEHLTDPAAGIREMWEALNDGGLLFISTPDAGSLVSKLLGKYWHYFDIIQHVALFNRNNLSRLLTDSGFEVVGFTSFGHYYRVEYIIERLKNLHSNNLLKYPIKCLGYILRPFKNITIYLLLGDVMGVVAKKIDRKI